MSAAILRMAMLRLVMVVTMFVMRVMLVFVAEGVPHPTNDGRDACA
jgi:hypothetical protein